MFVSNFATLKEAVNASTDGDYVMIKYNLILSEKITISKNITLLAGYELLQEGQDGYSQNNREITLKRAESFTTDYIFEVNAINANFGGAFGSDGNSVDFKDAVLNFDGSAVQSESFVFVNGGNLTLKENLIVKNNIATVGSAINVVSGSLTISGATICDNGDSSGTTPLSTSGGAIYAENSTVTITAGAIYNNQALNGGAIYLYGYSRLIMNEFNGDVYLYSNSASLGGAIYVDTSIQDESLAVDISFVEIFSNSAKDGGAIFINEGFVKLRNNASVYSNNAKNGGAIAVMNGTLVVEDATIGSNSRSGNLNAVGMQIAGNFATNNGGGIYVGASGILKMTNANSTISCNSAINGGNIYFASTIEETWGESIISAGQIQYGNESVNSNYGGAIFVASGVLNLLGDNLFIQNNMSYFGGAIYVLNAQLNIKLGVTISGNEAVYGGGLYIENGEVTINGANIVSNKANIFQNMGGNGGGIYVSGGLVEVGTSSQKTYVGNSMAGNEAMNNGGGIYVNNNSEVVLGHSAVICDNKSVNGAGVFASGGLIKFDGSEISFNDAVSNGGGIYLAKENSKVPNLMIYNNTLIDSNTALNGAGVFADNTLTISNATISNNIAKDGNLPLTKTGLGGAIYITNKAVVTLDTVTISENISEVDNDKYSGIYLNNTSKNALQISNSTLIDSTNLSSANMVCLVENAIITIIDKSLSDSSRIMLAFEYDYANKETLVATFTKASYARVSKFFGYDVGFTLIDVNVYVAQATVVDITDTNKLENYATLKDALMQIPSGEQRILQLIKEQIIDANSIVTVPQDKEVVIVSKDSGLAGANGRGYSISRDGNYTGILFAVYGTLSFNLDETNPLASTLNTNFYLTGSGVENSSSLVYIGGTGVVVVNSGLEIINNFATNSLKLELITPNTGVVEKIEGNRGGAFYVNGNSTDNYSLKIVNSSIYACTAQYGGAIYIENGKVEIQGGEYGIYDSSDANVQNNALKNGGAIYVSNGILQISSYQNNESVFSGNNAENGGAIYVDAGLVNISDANFVSNTATLEGGAIFLNSQLTSTLSNVTFNSNIAENGGAVIVVKGKIEAESSDFISNKATNNGGAIYIINDGFAKLSSSTLTSNFAQNGGAISLNANLLGNNYNLEIEGCTMDANGEITSATGVKQTTENGGAVYILKGKARVDYEGAVSSITLNKAVNGAGIFLCGGIIDIYQTEITSNSATSGGGIYNSITGVVNLYATVISTNNATNSSSSFGGGIYQSSGSLYINKYNEVACGISSNSSYGFGAGLYLIGGNVSMSSGSVSISNNYINASSATSLDGKRGAGMYVNGATVDMTSVEFVGNRIVAGSDIDVYGQGIYFEGGIVNVYGLCSFDNVSEGLNSGSICIEKESDENNLFTLAGFADEINDTILIAKKNAWLNILESSTDPADSNIFEGSGHQITLGVLNKTYGDRVLKVVKSSSLNATDESNYLLEYFNLPLMSGFLLAQSFEKNEGNFAILTPQYFQVVRTILSGEVSTYELAYGCATLKEAVLLVEDGGLILMNVMSEGERIYQINETLYSNYNGVHKSFTLSARQESITISRGKTESGDFEDEMLNILSGDTIYIGINPAFDKAYQEFCGENYANNKIVFSGGRSSSSENDTYNSYSRLINVASGGTLILGEGVKLTNERTELNGAAVLVQGTLYLEGGEISNNSSISNDAESTNGNGGGVYVCSNASFYMSSGVISGNFATKFGGGIYFSVNSTADISGGLIGAESTVTATAESHSNSARFGGGIYVQGISIDIYGTANISYNYASINGGGIYGKSYLNTNSFNPVEISVDKNISNNTTISNNLAGNYGGGIYIEDTQNYSVRINQSFENKTVLSIFGGSISKNSAVNGGGIYVKGYTSNADEISLDYTTAVLLSGGTVGGNTAVRTNGVGGLGGGIYLSGVEVLSDSENTTYISSNEGYDGAGMYVYKSLVSLLQNISITLNGKTDTVNNGGGIYVCAYSVLYLGDENSSSVRLSQNKAINGGGIYMEFNAKITIESATILSNTATNLGDGIFVNSARTHNFTIGAGMKDGQMTDICVYLSITDSVYLYGNSIIYVNGNYKGNVPINVKVDYLWNDYLEIIACYSNEITDLRNISEQLFYGEDENGEEYCFIIDDFDVVIGAKNVSKTSDGIKRYFMDIKTALSRLAEGVESVIVVFKDDMSIIETFTLSGDYRLTLNSGYITESGVEVIGTAMKNLHNGTIYDMFKISLTSVESYFNIYNFNLISFKDENGKTLMSSNSIINVTNGEVELDNVIFNGLLGSSAGTALNITGGSVVAKNISILNSSTSGNGLIYVFGNATLDIIDSVISSNTSDNGMIYVETIFDGVDFTSGMVRLQGVEISSNIASNGGAIYVKSGRFVTRGTINNPNTIISNNEASNGGGIYVESGTLELNNLLVSGNMAESVGNTANNSGGGIYVDNATVTFGNSVLISKNTAKVNGGGIFGTENSNITISSSVDLISLNQAVNGGGIYSKGILNIRNSSISANVASGNGGGIYSDENIILDNSSISLNTAKFGGGMFVDGVAEMANESVISSNIATDFGGGIYVGENGDLSIYGVGVAVSKVISNNAKNGGGIYVNGGSVTLDGGVIGEATKSNLATKVIDNNAYVGGNGAGVYVCGGGAFNISSGSVSYNESTEIFITENELIVSYGRGNGGGIYVNGGTVNMTGGNVGNNTAENGGGVYLTGSTSVFNLSGETATISYNVANYGAGVFVTETASLNVNGGEILNNSATFDGGGVYVSDGDVNMTSSTSSSYISSNEAVNGAGVFVGEKGNFIMSDSLSNLSNVSNNISTGNGGGVYVDANASLSRNLFGSFTMNGGEIARNTAILGAGVFVGGVINSAEDYYLGEFTMNKGLITLNIASESGGGVYSTGLFVMRNKGSQNVISSITLNTAINGAGVFVAGGSLNLESGAISSNGDIDFTNGGGLYLTSTLNNYSSYILDNVIISDNEALNGGGIYYERGVVTYKGVKLYENEAAYGGGLYVAGDESALCINSGEISDNTATNGGGVYVASGTFNFGNENSSVESAIISDNSATNGGGIYANGVSEKLAYLNITKASISSNTVSGSGGGLYIGEDCIADIKTSVQINNNKTSSLTSSEGGGIYISSKATTGEVEQKSVISASFIGNYAYKGGAMFVSSSANITLNYAVFDDNGDNGTLVTSQGGGIFSTGTMEIKNTRISNNTASQTGGGIAMDGGIITLSIDVSLDETTKEPKYGIISNSALNGAGVYVYGGTLKANSGYIYENNSTENGGGVYVAGGIVTLGSSLKVSNNQAINGGGVFIFSGTLNLESLSKIENNTAIHDGGGVYVATAGTFNLKGGTVGKDISDASADEPITASETDYSNYAYGNGGGVYIDKNASATFRSGSVAFNYSAGSGGGVYINALDTSSKTYNFGTTGTSEKDNFTMDIVSNFAKNDGGGIYVAGGTSTTIVMVKCNIGRSALDDEGKGIYLANKATNGGGVYLSNATLTIKEKGEISKNISYNYINYNIATNAGGGVYALNSIVNVKGIIGGNQASGNNGIGGFGGGIYSVNSKIEIFEQGVIQNNKSRQYIMVSGAYSYSAYEEMKNDEFIGDGKTRYFYYDGIYASNNTFVQFSGGIIKQKGSEETILDRVVDDITPYAGFSLAIYFDRTSTMGDLVATREWYEDTFETPTFNGKIYGSLWFDSNIELDARLVLQDKLNVTYINIYPITYLKTWANYYAEFCLYIKTVNIHINLGWFGAIDFDIKVPVLWMLNMPNIQVNGVNEDVAPWNAAFRVSDWLHKPGSIQKYMDEAQAGIEGSRQIYQSYCAVRDAIEIFEEASEEGQNLGPALEGVKLALDIILALMDSDQNDIGATNAILIWIEASMDSWKDNIRRTDGWEKMNLFGKVSNIVIGLVKSGIKNYLAAQVGLLNLGDIPELYAKLELAIGVIQKISGIGDYLKNLLDLF